MAASRRNIPRLRSFRIGHAFASRSLQVGRARQSSIRSFPTSLQVLNSSSSSHALRETICERLSDLNAVTFVHTGVFTQLPAAFGVAYHCVYQTGSDACLFALLSNVLIIITPGCVIYATPPMRCPLPETYPYCGDPGILATCNRTPGQADAGHAMRIVKI